ncbi:MAG: monofunctional biosynthetic peptidoglycan transglycosylase [Deltaproteobacteria bacterium]|nr:monofunctional biosynthetic peptidoglycan transglycosylase [Deltaproteobacteria bacterium]
MGKRKKTKRGRKSGSAKKRRSFLKAVTATKARKLMLLAALLLSGWCLYVYLSLPSGAEYLRSNPSLTPIMIERQDAARAEGRSYSIKYSWVDFREIPKSLTRAVLVAEDIAFFGHDGFDYNEVEAVFKEMVTELSFPRGASTITQQTAKNLYLSLSRDPFRKIKEAILTKRLEKNLSKTRILELYLNIIELGPGIFGVEEASRHYFGRSVRSISEREAAFLAAIIPAPLTTFSPVKAPSRVRKRQELIIKRMPRALLPKGF